MRLPQLAMVAVIALPPAGEGDGQAECRVTLEIELRTVAADPAFDEHALREEVERLWAPYGVAFCWRGAVTRCPNAAGRLEVHLQESIASPADDEARVRPIVGQIRIAPGKAVADVRLSLAGARHLAARAKLGGRALGSLPPNLLEGFVPRVLARALAHEIGHYVLASRDHAARGLMTARFRPDEVTLAPPSRLPLTRSQAHTVRATCLHANAMALVRWLEAR